MSISTGVVRAVALQQIYHAPHAKASAKGHNKGLQSVDGRRKELHITYLSYTDEPVSGKNFITAFAAGAEWGTREHTCCRLQYNTRTAPGECGGSRYATVALSKLRGFDKEHVWNAAGMSFQAHAATTQQKYNEGTPDVRLQHGYAVSDAITATELVTHGLPSVHGIYMGVGGLLKNIKHDDIYGPDFLTENLGKNGSGEKISPTNFMPASIIVIPPSTGFSA